MSRPAPFRNAAMALTLILLSLGAVGCAGNGTKNSSNPLADAMVGAGDQDAWRRLTNADNGLELRKWLVADNDAVITQAMQDFAQGDVLDEQTTARLARNGFRFVRIALSDLEPMLESLGGATVNLQGWHGQVLTWRPLHELALENEVMTLAVDGRVRRFQGGSLALLARAWTVQMEDGPFMQLELVPEHRRISRTTDLLNLLQNGRTIRRPMPSMAVDVRLAGGMAYVLTCEDPETPWTYGDADAVEIEPIADPDAAREILERESRSSMGPFVIGPDVEAPLTLGQKLLQNTSPLPQRGFLILIPKIPAAMYPPELLVSEPGGGS